MRKLPEWGFLINKGLNTYQSETLRTLRHIFRSLWVYYAFINEKIDLGIKKENLVLLKDILIEVFHYNENLFPYLLLFHDIGRPFNREWHTFESANLIKQNGLLVKLQLSLNQQLILYGAIKYHLLPGTIFTGESSYYGTISILNDIELEELWQSEEETHIFFQTLTAFTIIDILGYDYSRIFDHYFNYFEIIRQNLFEIFHKTRALEMEERRFKAFKDLSNLDIQNLKWRVSCALRIFQFVKTKPELTEEFYYSKIENGLKEIGNTWENFASSLHNRDIFIQFKYALPVLMILASFSFKREPIKNDQKVDENLFQFWQTCCNKVLCYHNKAQNNDIEIPKLWNFTFKLPRGWFYQKDYINFIRSEKFIIALQKINPKYDSKFDNYFVNFSVQF